VFLGWGGGGAEQGWGCTWIRITVFRQSPRLVRVAKRLTTTTDDEKSRCVDMDITCWHGSARVF